MELLIFGVTIYLIFLSWKSYTHVSHTLGRQAANMNWVVCDWVKDETGHKNVRLTRDGLIVEISYVNRNVVLIEPRHNGSFKDFIELDHWLVLKS
jgi:hypothetical protein